MCVWFDTTDDTYTLYRGACDDPARTELVGPYEMGADVVWVAAPTFTSPSGASAGVTFYARGTAWPGQVAVARDGSPKQYVLKVEGLTGRVSLT